MPKPLFAANKNQSKNDPSDIFRSLENTELETISGGSDSSNQEHIKVLLQMSDGSNSSSNNDFDDGRRVKYRTGGGVWLNNHNETMMEVAKL